MGGHHKNTCPLWGQNKILKAKGSKKRNVPKRPINLSERLP